MNVLVCLLFSLLSALYPPKEATIVFAGDAMQHKSQLDNANRKGTTYDYTECFAEISPWISEADYAVVNLETTLGASGYTGYPCFCSPDAYAVALRDAGFDLFLTANNHTLDRRDKGLRRTVSVLDSIGVDHIGTYTYASERESHIPFVKNINGFKVGFLNYTYGTNGIKIQGDVIVDYIDTKLISDDIRKTRDAGAELVIVMPHWGDEYHLVHNRNQSTLAEKFLSAGADAVIGGHPHVIQPMQMQTDSIHGNRPVVYSMGNFISGMRTTDTRGGALVQLKLTRDENGKARIREAAYRLVFTVPGVPGKRSDRLVFLDPDTNIPEVTGQYSGMAKGFMLNALRTFDKYNRDISRYIPANSQ